MFLSAAGSKATLLRLDKKLRNTVIDPLKECMIDGISVDYKILQNKVKSTHIKAVNCLKTLDLSFSQRQGQIFYLERQRKMEEDEKKKQKSLEEAARKEQEEAIIEVSDSVTKSKLINFSRLRQ